MAQLQTSLAKLSRIIASLRLDESQATVSSNLILIKQLAAYNHLVPLIEEIVGDAKLLAEIASRSYRHVNYFDKIVLVDSPNPRDYRLTLHLWIPPFSTKELSKESLHDHRFSFWSAILAGTLRSEDFIEDPSGQLMQHYKYVSEERTTDSRNLYEFVGDTHLIKSGTLQRSPGDAYFQAYEGVHRVLLPDTFSCTLVLRGPRRKSFTNTFRTDVPKVNNQATNIMYNTDAVKEKLKSLARSVSKG